MLCYRIEFLKSKNKAKRLFSIQLIFKVKLYLISLLNIKIGSYQTIANLIIVKTRGAILIT